VTDHAEAIAAAGSAARAEFESTHQARELTLASSRAAIRACALGVRAVHRREFDRARGHIAEAAALLTEAHDATIEHGDVRHAGFLHDAQKEYAEASLTLAFVEGGPLPTAKDLGVDAAAYLNGMAEAASELRRQVLDLLRADEPAAAEALFEVMDEVYGMLVTVDYPEAVTGGLRRSTDALRAVLERTRADITNAAVAARFRAAVEQTPPG
jgi:translin